MAREDRLALLQHEAIEARSQLLSVGLAFSRGDRLDLLPPLRNFARSLQVIDTADAALWVTHYLSVIDKLSAADYDIGRPRLKAEGANLEAAFVAATLQPSLLQTDAAARGYATITAFKKVGDPNTTLSELARAGDNLTGEKHPLLAYFLSGYLHRLAGFVSDLEKTRRDSGSKFDFVLTNPPPPYG